MENEKFNIINIEEKEIKVPIYQNWFFKSSFSNLRVSTKPPLSYAIFGVIAFSAILLFILCCFHLNNDYIIYNVEELCNAKAEDYYQNWPANYRFVQKTLLQLPKNEALECRREIAWFCDYEQYNSLKQQQDDLKTLLKAVESQLKQFRSNKAVVPNGTKVTLVMQQFCTIVQSKTITLCSPKNNFEPEQETACLDCLRHNVNCWNSNPFYVKGSQYHCKREQEWAVIGHRPVIIEANCRRKKV